MWTLASMVIIDCSSEIGRHVKRSHQYIMIYEVLTQYCDPTPSQLPRMKAKQMMCETRPPFYIAVHFVYILMDFDPTSKACHQQIWLGHINLIPWIPGEANLALGANKI
jgi:hypothetical protein